jgi:phosphatidylserine/phosphatidylglycerophosphate/cardiolipin synthase-like enzyme
MDSKTVLVGVIIGLVLGGGLGYFMAPSPDISTYESQISQLQSHVGVLQNEIDDLDDKLDDLQSQASSLNSEVNSKESTIIHLQSQISTKNEQIDEQAVTILEKNTLINELQSQIEAGISDDLLIDISFSRTDDTSALLIDWMDRANETIKIMVMLITHDELADALIEAQNRGIDVDIIIDDGWYFSSGSDYQRILDSGVDIRGDDRSGLMHHKVMIVDGYVVITGSHNWSDSAEDSNDENIIVLNSTGIAYVMLLSMRLKQTLPESIQVMSGLSFTTPRIKQWILEDGSYLQHTVLPLLLLSLKVPF